LTKPLKRKLFVLKLDTTFAFAKKVKQCRYRPGGAQRVPGN